MKKAKIKLDLEQDSAEIFGQSILLNQTTSSHSGPNLEYWGSIQN